MRSNEADARSLRDAAWVLRARGPEKRPFSLRVVIRVLERTADRIEKMGRERVQGTHVQVAAPRSSTPGWPET